MSDVAPNDPAIAAGLATNLNGLIAEFNSFVTGWQQRVDAVVVQIQNASASTEVAGGVTGQVPSGVSVQPEPTPEPTPPVDETSGPSTELTGSSPSTTPDDVGSTPPTLPPEDTGLGTTHDFLDPSGDDTITDPSGDDKTL